VRGFFDFSFMLQVALWLKITPPIMPARIDRGRLQTDAIRRKINIPQPIKAE